MDATNLAKLYDLPPVDWTGVEAALTAGPGQAPGDGGPNRHTWWLATIDADGTPHINGVGALWVDGALWFETGEHTRKGRNLARDPRCTASIALDDYDLVVRGRAQPVRDPHTVADMARRWAAGGWPCEVDASGTALTAPFSAPSAGSPPWLVYRMTVESATALHVNKPGGATSWRF